MQAWTLKDGPALPVDVVLLSLDLESRGCKLSAKADQLIVTGPNGPPELSDKDRQQITVWKRHLLALVAYCQVEHGAHLRTE